MLQALKVKELLEKIIPSQQHEVMSTYSMTHGLLQQKGNIKVPPVDQNHIEVGIVLLLHTSLLTSTITQFDNMKQELNQRIFRSVL